MSQYTLSTPPSPYPPSLTYSSHYPRTPSHPPPLHYPPPSHYLHPQSSHPQVRFCLSSAQQQPVDRQPNRPFQGTPPPPLIIHPPHYTPPPLYTPLVTPTRHTLSSHTLMTHPLFTLYHNTPFICPYNNGEILFDQAPLHPLTTHPITTHPIICSNTPSHHPPSF